ncbi:Acyl-CoA dehydrogenase [subsurface metagenome]
MNLDLSEEQEMLKRTARDFLEQECPRTLVREMEQDEKGYSPELWRKMAELGWMGLVFPEEYSGMSGNFVDLIILLGEMGRALVPGPFIPTVVSSGLPIFHHGTKEQKGNFLPKIASGELIMTLALTEPSARFDESGVEAKAQHQLANYSISGTKLFVPYAHVADWIICVTRTEEGITLFLIPAKSPGISFFLLKTIASDKQFEVTLDDVKVPTANVLGRVGDGWKIIKQIEEWSALAWCGYEVGSLQQVLEMTVGYANERIQFEQPIGSFQVIQHKCADMVIDIDGARFLTYQAAWKLSQGLPASMEISMAKAWTGEASRRVCLSGHQIHAGIGLFTDYDMELYFRRAKAMELAFGEGEFHREIVAQQLGL